MAGYVLENKETAVLELFPILVGLKLWEDCFSDKVVTIYTDSKALAPVLEKLYCKVLQKMAYSEANCPFVHAKQHTSHSRAYKRGRNISADLLSRKRNHFGETYPSMSPNPAQ